MTSQCRKISQEYEKRARLDLVELNSIWLKSIGDSLSNKESEVFLRQCLHLGIPSLIQRGARKTLEVIQPSKWLNRFFSISWLSFLGSPTLDKGSIFASLFFYLIRCQRQNDHLWWIFLNYWYGNTVLAVSRYSSPVWIVQSE